MVKATFRRLLGSRIIYHEFGFYRFFERHDNAIPVGSTLKRKVQGGTAYREVTISPRPVPPTRTNETNASVAGSGTSHQSEPSLAWSLCLVWHCRQLPSLAGSASVRRTLLAQNAERPESKGAYTVGSLPLDKSAVSVTASEVVSPLQGVTG